MKRIKTTFQQKCGYYTEIITLCSCFPVIDHTESIRKNPPTTNATGADVQREVAHYLKGSADRGGGRKARMERANNGDGDVPGRVEVDF